MQKVISQSQIIYVHFRCKWAIAGLNSTNKVNVLAVSKQFNYDYHLAASGMLPTKEYSSLVLCGQTLYLWCFSRFLHFSLLIDKTLPEEVVEAPVQAFCHVPVTI